MAKRMKNRSRQLADKLYPTPAEQEIADSILTVPPEQRRLHTETYDFSVSTIVGYVNERRIVVPEFQRHYVWTVPQASRLIESLVIQCPIPVLYFNQERDERLSVIDGNQRIKTLTDFIAGKFALKGLTAYPELEGLRFSELDPRFQRHILNRTLRCITIMKDTHPQVKFDVFERLNTGSVRLSSQELRHGLYYGPLMKVIESAAKRPEFRALLSGTPERRMKAEEYVLRFLALHYSFEDYRKPLSGFLNDFADKHRHLSDNEATEFIRIFEQAVDGVAGIFGELAFKIFDHKLQPASAFNAALFDAEMLAVSRAASSLKTMTATRRKKTLDRLAALFEDESFSKAIGRATSDEVSIRRRVEAMSALLAGV